jgi:hypothetical protein
MTNDAHFIGSSSGKGRVNTNLQQYKDDKSIKSSHTFSTIIEAAETLRVWTSCVAKTTSDLAIQLFRTGLRNLCRLLRAVGIRY